MSIMYFDGKACATHDKKETYQPTFYKLQQQLPSDCGIPARFRFGHLTEIHTHHTHQLKIMSRINEIENSLAP